MDRRRVVMYMNNSLHHSYGQITHEDGRFFSHHIKNRTGVYLAPEVIINAALNSPRAMLEKYKEGLWNALIKDYNLIVTTLGDKGKELKIIAYR